jgi:hypothetical protein
MEKKAAKAEVIKYMRELRAGNKRTQSGWIRRTWEQVQATAWMGGDSESGRGLEVVLCLAAVYD